MFLHEALAHINFYDFTKSPKHYRQPLIMLLQLWTNEYIAISMYIAIFTVVCS